jgi:hypothetical protein
LKLLFAPLKHNAGVICDVKGERLIRDFKFERDNNIVDLRKYRKIRGIVIGDILSITLRLYIFITDLVSYLFNYRCVNISSKENIIERLCDYQIREEYMEFLKTVNDGSFIFVDLDQNES